jgi:O-antigen ligase
MSSLPSSSVRPDARSGIAAVSALTALAVLSPWAFGGVSRGATSAITIAGAAVGAAGAGALVWRRRPLPALPLVWPLAGLVALAAFQLVPLPAAVHRLLAPGSASLWHPAEPVAADVLGAEARPISIAPEATRRSLGLLAAIVGLALLSAPALSRRRTAIAVAVAIAVAGLGVALFGIVSHLLFPTLLYGRLAVPTVSPFGPFVSKNHFAGYVEMAALLTLGLALGLADQSRRPPSFLSWIEGPRAGRVLAAFGASMTMILALLVCQSRGGAIALAGGLLGLAALRLRKPRTLGGRNATIAVVSLLALGAGLVYLVLPQRSRDRLEGLGRAVEDPAGAFRLGVWKDGLRAGAASPLVGFGLGTFGDALPSCKTSAGELRVEHAENEAVEQLVESGLLGLGLSVVALLLLLRGLAARGPDVSRLHDGLAAGAGAGVVALAVHGLVDFNLHVPSNALLFALLVALRLGFELQPPEARRLRVPALPVAAALAAVLWTSATLVAAPSRPDLSALRGRAAGSMRSRIIESGLARHLQRRPADAEAWVLLGWLRAATDAESGRALARYGADRDPRRSELRAVADQLDARVR